jgi:hypothetical protein
MRRQARWSEYLSSFDYLVIYRPGRLGGKPDALTRRSDVYPLEGGEGYALANPQNLQTIINNARPLSDDPILHSLLRATSDEDRDEDRDERNDRDEDRDDRDEDRDDRDEDPDDTDTENPNNHHGIADSIAILTLIKDGVKEDEFAQKTIARLQEHANDLTEDAREQFATSEDKTLLLYKGRVYVPDYRDVRLATLQTAHDHILVGHPGIHKTLRILMRRYYWPGMTSTVKDYVKSCTTCARAKASHHTPFGPLKFLPIPERPWNSIAMDFITGLPTSNGHDAILVIIDRFTKMGLFIPTTATLTAEGLADLITVWVVAKHGTPADIVSDRGAVFTSNFWKSLTQRLAIKRNLSTAYHPETDGQTERLNQILEQYLRIYVDYLQDDWNSLLPLAEFAYNNATHSATGVTPFFANKGYHPNLEINTEQVPSVEASQAAEDLRDVHRYLREQLTITREQYEQQAEGTRIPFPTLAQGDLVYLDARNIKTKRPSKKLDNKRLGPYPIVEKISTHAYRLGLPHGMKQIHNTFHVRLLEPAHPNSFPNRVQPPSPPVEIDGELEYEIAEVVDSKIDRRRRGQGLLYRVRWGGYEGTEEEFSWLPADELANAPDVIAVFHEQHPDKPGPNSI